MVEKEWLHQQAVKLPMILVPAKLRDHHCEPAQFLRLLDARRQSLQTDAGLAAGFRQEMRRLLPADLVARTVESEAFWKFLTSLIDDLSTQTRNRLSGTKTGEEFQM